jgi:hypothetical protein
MIHATQRVVSNTVPDFLPIEVAFKWSFCDPGVLEAAKGQNSLVATKVLPYDNGISSTKPTTPLSSYLPTSDTKFTYQYIVDKNRAGD